eukprot:scpid46046/ scgid4685/ Serine-enriched protein
MLNPAATYLQSEGQNRMPASRTSTGEGGLSDHRSMRSDDDEYPNSETELESRSVASSSTTGSADMGSVSSNGMNTTLVESSDGAVFVRVENKQALADDLRLLASLPELCDVTFLVGEERQPICGVRAILAARSRVMRKLLLGDQQFPSMINTQSKVTGGKNHKENGEQSGLTKSKTKSKLFAGKSTDNSPSIQRSGSPSLQFPNGITVAEFEPEVFKQLIEYLHTGSCHLQARTLLGLINAADHFSVDELKQACLNFASRCINTDTVCPLLRSAEIYIQYKSTKLIVQKVMEYIDENADTVLGLRSFATLPKHIVQLILSRDEMKTAELNKFHAAHEWCKAYCEEHTAEKLSDVMNPLVENIAFHKIPVMELMRDVRPLRVVPDGRIMTALAYQADPNAVEANDLQPKSRQAGGSGGSSRNSSPT